MKTKKSNLASFILVGIMAAIFAFIFSSIAFKSPAHTSSAATAPVISSRFPDTIHDPAYTSIFNNQALDPARPVSVGSSSNNVPFNSSQ